MTKGKVLNLILIVTSFVGYLEWGGGNHLFLIQAEIEVLSKLITDPGSVLHPLTLLPLAGQAVLVFTLFQSVPSRLLTFIGIAGIGLLMVVMLLAGAMGANVKVILSTAPFLVTSVLTVMHHRVVGAE